jgi:hypothetical protein
LSVARLAAAVAATLTVAAPALAGLPAKLKPSGIVRVATVDGADLCTARASNSNEVDTLLKPDGTTEPFTIPAGKVFVVTGINYSGSGTVGQASLLFVSLLNRAAATTTLHIAHTASHAMEADGPLAVSEDLAVPIVVSPGAAMCSQSFGDAPVSRLVLEGYLTKDR